MDTKLLSRNLNPSSHNKSSVVTVSPSFSANEALPAGNDAADTSKELQEATWQNGASLVPEKEADNKEDSESKTNHLMLALIAGALCLSMFCVGIDNTILATATP
jgi:hypothetical protein